MDLHNVKITQADVDKITREVQSRNAGHPAVLHAQGAGEVVGDFCNVYNGGLKTALQIAQTALSFLNPPVATAIGVAITALDKACA